MAKPPHRNARSCNIGLGRLSITAAMPIRNGSKLTATAIRRIVIHMVSVTAVARDQFSG